MLLRRLCLSVLIIAANVSAEQNIYTEISEQLLDTPIKFHEAVGLYNYPIGTKVVKKDGRKAIGSTLKHIYNTFNIMLDTKKNLKTKFQCVFNTFNNNINLVVKNKDDINSIKTYFKDSKKNGCKQIKPKGFLHFFSKTIQTSWSYMCKCGSKCGDKKTVTVRVDYVEGKKNRNTCIVGIEGSKDTENMFNRKMFKYSKVLGEEVVNGSDDETEGSRHTTVSLQLNIVHDTKQQHISSGTNVYVDKFWQKHKNRISANTPIFRFDMSHRKTTVEKEKLEEIIKSLPDKCKKNSMVPTFVESGITDSLYPVLYHGKPTTTFTPESKLYRDQFLECLESLKELKVSLGFYTDEAGLVTISKPLVDIERMDKLLKYLKNFYDTVREKNDTYVSNKVQLILKTNEDNMDILFSKIDPWLFKIKLILDFPRIVVFGSKFLQDDVFTNDSDKTSSDKEMNEGGFLYFSSQDTSHKDKSRGEGDTEYMVTIKNNFT
eukprot:GHVR01191649.1.p1 GENE.GHVR01191649.1~~GHVR01191649.1.p1  ORF type:complete len:489 (+),score=55.55 GHVR01191649.1:104-1570(+)